MIKRLLVAISLFLSLISFAQQGSSSPYSFYGLGEARFKGTVENRSMGGISVIPDSIHMNLQNPAFYPYLKLVGLTLGGSYETTKLKSNTDTEKAKRTTLDYMGFAVPMGKFGAGLGLLPYSAVGYKIQTIPTIETPQLTQYSGDGGLNKAFLGAGYQLTKKFTVGVELSYYFGDVETSSITSVANVQYGTREINESIASGAGMSAGVSYNSKIGKKLMLSASALFAPKTTLSLSNQRKLALIQFLSSGIDVIDEQIVDDIEDTKVKMPSKTTFGASIGQPRKWMVGTEFAFVQSNNSGNRFNDIEGAEFDDGFKYGIGGYYIPNYASYSGYLNKITYRGGFKYEKTGLVLNNKAITDAGMTLGLGLPLSGTFSNINIGFEFGKRGTRDAGLIEENYLNFTVGLSFNDRWFVKKKYD